jgi:hypothetical protein
MAQNWTDDVFANDHQGTTDLQNIENNFGCVKSNFSGASSPSNAVAGMFWYHSTYGLRIRNAGNTSWQKVLQGNVYGKMWIFRNDTSEGWLIESSVTDKVLAVKGGTQAYNVSGGNTAGAWVVSGLASATESADHSHTVPNHSHVVDTISIDIQAGGTLVATAVPGGGSTSTGGISSGHSHTITQGGAWRPSAAVGTLQYPDLT